MEHFWQKISRFAFQRSESAPLPVPAPADSSDTARRSSCRDLEVWVSTLLKEPCRSVTIYRTALTHRSVVHDSTENLPAETSNQRLEFLGDAVLDLIISEHLYRLFPESDEGHLSSNRAKIVNRKSLAGFARAIDLGEKLIIGESADKRSIRFSESTLADAFEAFIGAIYLDKGLDAARGFIARHVIELVDVRKLATIEHNHKSRLIEFAQSNRMPSPVYSVVGEEGAEHAKTFIVQVSVDGRVCGTGKASRKKDAEQAAAFEALQTLQNSDGNRASAT
ncbi:ribonuclease III [Prosthecochloris sp. N3]|uniref:Ribonuclease 3 n=1 Tax=Prosthecochloris ethylica TaxID=2743976 RepID=A0ABR9XQX6_9CHLB|nr:MULTISPECIES: ribonuclease III [Prosthecochloris]MBF0586326.1 ribonuclease III [Prosthecochloris ethylica]MBF0636456.1 ribonuclease III [Prosthecochloris ethylica]NUK47630.1 ribonuclease III [Prosthecochloris ethylica]RNA64136.1 ribonuclease III [Prosthecochloris sp. ZM_2]